MSINNCVIRSLVKYKVVHSTPGRLRLKVKHVSKIPAQAKLYDKYVVDGVKIIGGIKNIEFNYITGSILIEYDTTQVYEEKILKWIDKVIDVAIEERKIIEKYSQSNLDYVMNTLEQKLKDEVKHI